MTAGDLRWKAPTGSWVILRLGYTSTGQRNVAAPAAGHGLECDKFTATPSRSISKRAGTYCWSA